MGEMEVEEEVELGEGEMVGTQHTSWHEIDAFKVAL